VKGERLDINSVADAADGADDLFLGGDDFDFLAEAVDVGAGDGAGFILLDSVALYLTDEFLGRDDPGSLGDEVDEEGVFGEAEVEGSAVYRNPVPGQIDFYIALYQVSPRLSLSFIWLNGR
jgi:hypothetical protein